MKYNIALLFGLIIYVNVFSQTKEIYYDSIVKEPYTLNINNNQFRFRVFDIDRSFVILEELNSNWNSIDTFEIGDLFYLKDINNDKFPDIGLPDKPWADVYLYNPQKATFIKSGVYNLSEFEDYGEPRMQLLDRNLNVFFDYESYRGNWESILFQIKDFKRINLGSILMDN